MHNERRHVIVCRGEVMIAFDGLVRLTPRRQRSTHAAVCMPHTDRTHPVVLSLQRQLLPCSWFAW